MRNNVPAVFYESNCFCDKNIGKRMHISKKKRFILIGGLSLILGAFYFSFPSSTDRYVTIQSHKLSVEMAYTPYLYQQGLMGRRSLPKNQGMLFIFPYSDHLSFWMKNTLIPLSIAFINREGIITEIIKMDLGSQCKAREKVPFALEVNQGWFENNNIQIGDSVYFSHTVQLILRRTLQE